MATNTIERKQGNAELAINSGGTLTLAGTASVSGTATVASGGTLAVASGGTLSAASGATITINDAASIAGVVRVKHNTVARTDTTAKDLFTLPAGAVPLAVRVIGATGSDAGTTATLSIGKTGTATHFVNAMDVKSTAGVGQIAPTAANLGASVGASAITVIGTYAETGGAATTGGPWRVVIEYAV